MENLIKEALEDPQLQNTLDINEIMEKGNQSEFLQNNSLSTISQDIFDKIAELPISQEKKKDWCDKLIGFRLVNELYELQKGKLVKIIGRCEKTQTWKLHMKGKMVSVKFLDNGTHVVCLLGANRYSQFLFNETILFQKLSLEEQMILQANEFLQQQP